MVYGLQQRKNFDRFLRKGHPVKIIDNGKHYVTIVTSIEDDYVNVKSPNGIVRMNINDVYPIWWYSYKPKKAT